MATAKPKMIAVENVNTPGRTSNVDAIKYEAMRKALMKALPAKLPGLTQAEMLDELKKHLSQEHFPGGEKAGWWMKSVQLDLEAKGVILRDKTAKPMRWRKAK